jgi:hypothetical protein
MGAMSTIQDVDALVDFLRNTFISTSTTIVEEAAPELELVPNTFVDELPMSAATMYRTGPLPMTMQTGAVATY